jgi:hypothetical protein
MIASLDADCPACGIPVAEHEVERIRTSLHEDGTCVRCLRSANETARKRMEIERELLQRERDRGPCGRAYDPPPVTPENLRRNELTRYAKRWQLWGLGVKGDEADELLAGLYGSPDHGRAVES